MTYGIKGLRRVNLGKEATAGTAVAPTTTWRGNGDMLEDKRTVSFPDELSGIVGGIDRSYIAKYEGSWKIADTPATFEQLGYLLSSAFGFPGTAASANGTARIYQRAIPTTSVPSPAPGGAGGTAQTYTIEAGDNIEAEQATYGLVTKTSFTFVGGEAVKVSGELIARSVGTTNTAGTFNSTPSLPVVEDILAGLGTVYLDSISGTYATTVFSNRVLGGKLDCTWKWIPKWTIDNGRLDFAYAVYTGHDIKGELTLEQAANTSGLSGSQYDNWRTQTAQLLTLRLNGGSISGAGTLATAPFGTIATKALIFALPIKYTSVSALGDQSGNGIRTFSFDSEYNVTAGNAGTIVIVNSNGSLV